MNKLNEYMIAHIEEESPGLLKTIRYGRWRRHNLDLHSLCSLVECSATWLETRVVELQAEAERLATLDPVDATPHWRKNSDGQPTYLYLIHPTQDDGSRRREYIGVKKEAIDHALGRIEAWSDLQGVNTELALIAERLADINKQLIYALLDASGLGY